MRRPCIFSLDGGGETFSLDGDGRGTTICALVARVFASGRRGRGRAFGMRPLPGLCGGSCGTHASSYGGSTALGDSGSFPSMKGWSRQEPTRDALLGARYASVAGRARERREGEGRAREGGVVVSRVAGRSGAALRWVVRKSKQTAKSRTCMITTSVMVCMVAVVLVGCWWWYLLRCCLVEES